MKKYIDVDFNCGMTIEEAVKYLRQFYGRDYKREKERGNRI